MERTPKPKITRNRELRACTECRKRKLKCDKQHPCSACKRRDESAGCFFERRFEGQLSEQERRMRAEARLGHLERLVQELSRTDDGLLGAGDLGERGQSEFEKQGGKDGGLDNVVKHGSTHWSAMLDDIDELRDVLGEPDQIGTQEETGGSDIKLLFGFRKCLSFQQTVSQYLPPRMEADRLVAAYFRAKAVKAPLIHAAHFSRLYRIFWENPAAASPLWTSILFSVFYIVARTLLPPAGADGDENRKPTRFAIAAAQCLVAGEYHRPQKFAVEALALFAQAKCLAGVSISPDLALLFSTIIRLATLMGYHRDPDTSPQSLSPFEGEMRRRTWSLCMQLDILVSFQLGIPSNVQFPTWNTKPPTNLLDSDFDEETVKLPPERPLSEPTELVFYIVKHKLATIFEKILQHSLSTNKEPDLIELERISTELKSTYEDLPTVFKPRLVSDSIVDSPSVIVTRLCVNAIYQKCVCVLHQKHVILWREESICACYEAASDLVKRFVDVYQEFEPGGQLETEKWFIGSITWHDFYLGCSTLCLVVCVTKRRRDLFLEDFEGFVVDVKALLELLQKAKCVLEICRTSIDTRKVRQLIDASILKFNNKQIAGNNAIPNPDWLAVPYHQGETNWPWDENIAMVTEDPAWTYMQQFLDLPSENDMMET